jgi:hypothetical protein
MDAIPIPKIRIKARLYRVPSIVYNSGPKRGRSCLAQALLKK